MKIEDLMSSKQTNLPIFNETRIDEGYQPLYAVRDGHIVLKHDQAISISGTYIGPMFLDRFTAERMTAPTELPWVLSEIYGDASNPSAVSGYLIIGIDGKPQVVTLSRLADFLTNLPKPLANAEQDTNYLLGKRLKLTSQVHRLFTYFPNQQDDQTKGIRNQDGSIKLLLPDRISRTWFCSLTYPDLHRLYDYYNQTIFDNKLTQRVTFKWLEGTDAPIYTEIKLEPESDVSEADLIKGYKVGRTIIYINREFFKIYPQLFIELFITALIHSLGMPGFFNLIPRHATLFNHYCEEAKKKLPGLETSNMNLKGTQEPQGKWTAVDLKNIASKASVGIFCPVCDSLMRQGKGSTGICSTQGHTIQFK